MNEFIRGLKELDTWFISMMGALILLNLFISGIIGVLIFLGIVIIPIIITIYCSGCLAISNDNIREIIKTCQEIQEILDDATTETVSEEEDAK